MERPIASSVATVSTLESEAVPVTATHSQGQSHSVPATRTDIPDLGTDADLQDTRVSALPAAIDFGSDMGPAVSASSDDGHQVFSSRIGGAFRVVAGMPPEAAEATLRASPTPGFPRELSSDVFTLPSSGKDEPPSEAPEPEVEVEATLVNAPAPGWSTSVFRDAASGTSAPPTRDSVVQAVRELALRLEREEQVKDAALLYQALAFVLQSA